MAGHHLRCRGRVEEMFKWKESFHPLIKFHLIYYRASKSPFTLPLQEQENFPLRTLLNIELNCADVGLCLTLVIL